MDIISEPLIENAAYTRRAVRCVIVLGILGIVQNLIDILRIGAFDEDDLRPPFLQIRRDLDELDLRLVICRGIDIPVASSGDTNCCTTHSRRCLECGRDLARQLMNDRFKTEHDAFKWNHPNYDPKALYPISFIRRKDAWIPSDTIPSPPQENS